MASNGVKPHKMRQSEQLTRTQEQAIFALLRSTTISEAATACQLDEFHLWLELQAGIKRLEIAGNGRFFWTALREQAADLVADGQLREWQIAKQLGIGHRTLARWKANPEFRARVASIVEAARVALLEATLRDCSW